MCVLCFLPCPSAWEGGGGEGGGERGEEGGGEGGGKFLKVQLTDQMNDSESLAQVTSVFPIFKGGQILLF